MKNIHKNQSGIAAIEFALVLPFLLILFLASMEISRYLILQQRVERSGYALANLTSQYMPAATLYVSGQISTYELNTNVLPQFNTIMAPYSTDATRLVIISSVTKANGVLIINWQMAGGGSLSNADTYSVVTNYKAVPGVSWVGKPANFTSDYNPEMQQMVEGENTIVTEVFYDYTPLLKDSLNGLGLQLLNERTMISRTFSHPRQGALITLPVTTS